MPAVPASQGVLVARRPTAAGERVAVISFYLALMTSVSLDLIGAEGDVVVEGPFAANSCFTRMLATATGRRVVTSSSGVTGTSIGAALLAAGEGAAGPADATDAITPPVLEWQSYCAAWRTAVG